MQKQSWLFFHFKTNLSLSLTQYMLGSGNWDAAPLSLTVQQQHDQVMALIDDDEDDEDQHLQQIELTHKHACSYCGTCGNTRDFSRLT